MVRITNMVLLVSGVVLVSLGIKEEAPLKILAGITSLIMYMVPGKLRE